MEFSAGLNIGGSIRVGVIQLLNSACRLVVVSPLSETVGVNYVTAPSAESAVAVKGSAYSSEESLDKTMFVLKGIDSMCLWLSDNGDEITINNHSGAATCVDDAVCSNCGKVYEQAKGHTLVPTAAKVPTCTEPGNTAYWQCAVCSKYFRDENAQNEIAREDTETAPAGHKFANGKCAACGAADPSYKAPASQETDKGEDTSLKSPSTGRRDMLFAHMRPLRLLWFSIVYLCKTTRLTFAQGCFIIIAPATMQSKGKRL